MADDKTEDTKVTKPAKPDPRAEAIEALILKHLSNGPISQSTPTWEHLRLRMPEMVADILGEL